MARVAAPPPPLLRTDLRCIAGQETIVQVVQIPPNGRAPKRIHPDGHEIIYVLEGETFLEIDGQPSQSQVYPTSVRAWGVGFCFATGRFGAVLGSVLAGLLLGAGLSINSLFYISGGVLVIGVIASIFFIALYRNQLREMRHHSVEAERFT